MKACLLLLALCASLPAQLLPVAPPTPVSLTSDSGRVTFVGAMSDTSCVAIAPCIWGTVYVNGEPFPIEPCYGAPFSMGIVWRWKVGDDTFNLFIMPYMSIGGVYDFESDFGRPVCLAPL